MKPSLEEERRALLKQIEASRATYRRMLGGKTDATHARQMHIHSALNHPTGKAVFPRSRTVKWVMEHPLAVATSVALLVWVLPRWWVSHSSPHKAITVRESGISRTTNRVHADLPAERDAHALITTVALLLRNPVTLLKLGRFADVAWQWIQQRRQQMRT